jgi:hypothetical protein
LQGLRLHHARARNKKEGLTEPSPKARQINAGESRH